VRQGIVTLPLNVLNTIAFTPPLAADIVAVAEEGQASTGCKVWLRVKGHIGRMAALGPSSCALNYFQYEYDVDEDSLIVAFGSDATRIDITDADAVEAALREWIPDIQVVAVDAHDWVADDLAAETWPMLRPNQLAAVQHAATEPHGRIRLAGSDFAQGWAGFIDGAIESGKTAAARVCVTAHLRHTGHPPDIHQTEESTTMSYCAELVTFTLNADVEEFISPSIRSDR
jgi:monoamine oxidase